MSSRVREKQRRRLERLENQRRDTVARRRRRTAAVVLAATTVAASIAVATLVGSSDPDSAFGPNTSGVLGRAAAVHVPPGIDGPGSPHAHPNLYVFVRGRRIDVPAGLGIDPSGRMVALHTHSGDGVVHVEGMRAATLGQLFRVWGVTLTRRRLGPFATKTGENVSVWRDGVATRDLSAVVLTDGENIAVSLGAQRPPIA